MELFLFSHSVQIFVGYISETGFIPSKPNPWRKVTCTIFVSLTRISFVSGDSADKIG